MHVIRHRRSLLGLSLAFAVAAVFGSASQQAAAYGTYVHGGITACAVCHLDGHTCHPGYRVPSATTMCWTCHTSGQDMSGLRSDAACTSGCHLVDGATSTHIAHADRPATCATCHPLTVSLTDAGGSPHHARPLPPAPVVAGFAPLSAAAGDLVTLTGTGFVGAYEVSFNGAPASVFDLISGTRITAIVPIAATSGPVSVTTLGGTGASATSLSVITVVTAKVTLRAEPTAVSLGKAVRLAGELRPMSLAGRRVRLAVKIKRRGEWTTVRTTLVRTAPSGAFAWTYRPSHRGLYRAQATLAATAAHAVARSHSAAFRVRLCSSDVGKLSLTPEPRRGAS
jgi:hypothetical protein